MILDTLYIPFFIINNNNLTHQHLQILQLLLPTQLFTADRAETSTRGVVHSSLVIFYPRVEVSGDFNTLVLILPTHVALREEFDILMKKRINKRNNIARIRYLDLD